MNGASSDDVVSIQKMVTLTYITPMNTIMIFTCVIIFHLLHFQQILYLTCLGAILRMHPGKLSKNLEFGIVSPGGEALAKFLGKARFGH